MLRIYEALKSIGLALLVSEVGCSRSDKEASLIREARDGRSMGNNVPVEPPKGYRILEKRIVKESL